jgi:uncharacterized protein YdhG (YjbR/CyaY superfamily)
MDAKPPVPSTVDDYILGFPEGVQSVLHKVRQAVRAAAPDAEEVISYRMPALRLNGVLVYYAAFKHHIGFYPPVRGDVALEREAAPYAGEKGNLRFPFDAPIPYELIGRLTALRAGQDRLKGRR